MSDFLFKATSRQDLGKGASRRLRRTGQVPAIIYGGDKAPMNLSLNHNEVLVQFRSEAVYSHILTVEIDGKPESAILRDVQRHPYKPLVTHLDFLRINANEKIRVSVPLHFLNAETCPGVKLEGGQVTHLMSSIEINVLPNQLPEFIEVDLASLKMGETIHISEIKLPISAESVVLAHGHDEGVATVIHTRQIAEPETATATATETATEEK